MGEGSLRANPAPLHMQSGWERSDTLGRGMGRTKVTVLKIIGDAAWPIEWKERNQASKKSHGLKLRWF